MEPSSIIIIIIVGVVLLLVFYVIGVYNKLVNARNKVKDQFAQIDVQLKRRSDMIPNLVETVKGYAKHEENTFKEVIEARNKFTVASTPEDEMKANNELTGAIRQLFALSESYPELKADTSFLKLQSNLEETEDKISSARQFYNDSVVSYNNKIELFPSSIIASMFHFEKEKFFEASADERKNVQVKF